MFDQDTVLWPFLLVMGAMLIPHFESFYVCLLYYLCLLDLIYLSYFKLLAVSKTDAPKDK